MRAKTEQNEINNKQRQINQTSSQENRYRGAKKNKKGNNQSNIRSKRTHDYQSPPQKKQFENHKGKKTKISNLHMRGRSTCQAWQMRPATSGRWTCHAWQMGTGTRGRSTCHIFYLPHSNPGPATPKPLPAHQKPLTCHT